MKHFNKFCPLCGLRAPFHRPACTRPPPVEKPEPPGLDDVSRPLPYVVEVES